MPDLTGTDPLNLPKSFRAHSWLKDAADIKMQIAIFIGTLNSAKKKS